MCLCARAYAHIHVCILRYSGPKVKYEYHLTAGISYITISKILCAQQMSPPHPIWMLALGILVGTK